MITARELHEITGKVIEEDDLFDGISVNKMIIIIEAMAKTAASLGMFRVVIPLIGGIDSADYNELCDKLVANGYDYYLDSYCNLEVSWGRLFF